MRKRGSLLSSATRVLAPFAPLCRYFLMLTTPCVSSRYCIHDAVPRSRMHSAAPPVTYLLVSVFSSFRAPPSLPSLALTLTDRITPRATTSPSSGTPASRSSLPAPARWMLPQFEGGEGARVRARQQWKEKMKGVDRSLLIESAYVASSAFSFLRFSLVLLPFSRPSLEAHGARGTGHTCVHFPCLRWPAARRGCGLDSCAVARRSNIRVDRVPVHAVIHRR
ncbi:hypothetical protein B0H14DRAFT_2798753 [Mycena olivaceomarginata]|nr:hypothetical protein B0H14DRAFT_2798753 [Mycena olivaceomarginata]